MSELSYSDPCTCGHSFEDHVVWKDKKKAELDSTFSESTVDGDLTSCQVLGCECTEYEADTSWTDEQDEQDMLDIEESI